MIFWLCACVFTPYRLEQAVHKYDAQTLVDFLQNGQHGYIRERAALGLAQISKKEPIPSAQKALRSCLSQKNEFDYVRGACAQTLAVWKDPQVADLIIQALPSVDEETRYWMAYALKDLDLPQARAQLSALRTDSDPLLSFAVRQWLEE